MDRDRERSAKKITEEVGVTRPKVTGCEIDLYHGSAAATTAGTMATFHHGHGAGVMKCVLEPARSEASVDCTIMQ